MRSLDSIDFVVPCTCGWEHCTLGILTSPLNSFHFCISGLSLQCYSQTWLPLLEVENAYSSNHRGFDSTPFGCEGPGELCCCLCFVPRGGGGFALCFVQAQQSRLALSLE